MPQSAGDGATVAVQLVDISEKVVKLIADFSHKITGKTVSIAAATFNKLQATGVGSAQYFTDRDTAEAWLFSAE